MAGELRIPSGREGKLPAVIVLHGSAGVTLWAPSGLQFAAHIGLYLSCHVTYRDEDKVTGRPIRLFHGLADDWNAIEQCREYVERLRKTGVDVTLTAYPGAHHAYDNFERKSEAESLPDAQTARNCRVLEVDAGVRVNAVTGRPFTINDECIERGVHVAYNQTATEATVSAVKELLGTVFGLKSQTTRYEALANLRLQPTAARRSQPAAAEAAR